MTMSLVRGMTSLNTKKQKSKKKTAKQIAAEAEHEAYLKKLGVGKTKLPTNAKGERVGINAIPNYKVVRVTSDIIPAHGSAKERSQYTGTEIAGIVTTHKSNAQPIRKDNKQAAVDAANMRS
jgi:hypothetical protein